jgi:hypothetical protein
MGSGIYPDEGGLTMVDTFGRWAEESDYSEYPILKWCDLDHVANFIRKQGYEPKIDMGELCERIIWEFCEDYEYEPHYGNDLMICMPNLMFFVEACGGVKEFDYEV